jgi:hypothetical protein
LDHKESRAEFEVVASNDPEFKTYVTHAQQGLDPDPQFGGVWSANALHPLLEAPQLRWRGA